MTVYAGGLGAFGRAPDLVVSGINRGLYLRELLRALAEIDTRNQYFIFTNQETGPDLVPPRQNCRVVQQRVRAAFRPARIVWEQTALPLAVARLRLDALLNPGFTAPVYCPCPAVTVFHDMQHKRHPEHFRWFDLPFWRMLLYASAHRATLLLADSEATRADVLHYYRLPPEARAPGAAGCRPCVLRVAARAREAAADGFDAASAQGSGCRCCMHSRSSGASGRTSGLVIAGLRGFHTEAVESLRAGSGTWRRGRVYRLDSARAASTICTPGPGRSCILRHSKDSVCLCSKRWPPEFPTACSNIQPLSRDRGRRGVAI